MLAARLAAMSSWAKPTAWSRSPNLEDARLVVLCGDPPPAEQAAAFFVVYADPRRHRQIAERADRPPVANLESFRLAVLDASLFERN